MKRFLILFLAFLHFSAYAQNGKIDVHELDLYAQKLMKSNFSNNTAKKTIKAIITCATK